MLMVVNGASDNACQDTGASKMAYASNLEPKLHTVALSVAASSSHEAWFIGGLVSLILVYVSVPVASLPVVGNLYGDDKRVRRNFSSVLSAYSNLQD